MKSKKPYTLLNKAEPYLWILPSVILMAVFILVPIGFVFRMAFSTITKSGLVKGFCGFDNFVKVLKGAETYEIKANANEPVLVAIERAGIKAPSRCRAGECGWCRSKLLSGEVFVPADAEYRRWGDKEHGYIHPCCSFATSDLVIEVPGEYLG